MEVTAKHIRTRYYENIGETAATPGDNFNVDAEPYWESVENVTFDTVDEAIRALRNYGVRFNANNSGWGATLPDGSFPIDYATGARETSYWEFRDASMAGWWLAAVTAGVDHDDHA